ncbi:helix-turn-helix domain-containing protein [Carbonactinospora thermoautotrophica]|nr:helix-turn-helix transcriptional regulator [Carbonactinospora thermoautotrophica]
MPDQTDASDRRQDLAEALRLLRKRAGLTGQTVARRAGMSQSKVSKIETGRLLPSVLDVERILKALEVPHDVGADLIRLARQANTEARSWRAYERLGYHKKQQELAAIEAQTRTLRLFQNALIPGLLQTPEYVQAVFGRKSHLSPDARAKAIAARLERQNVLYDQRKEFIFVMTESVLRWRICPNAVMVTQLDRIGSLSRMENIRVGVIPWSARPAEFPLTSFCLFDNRLVTVEAFHCELATRDPKDVNLYFDRFDALAASAIFGDSAREMLSRLAEEYRKLPD